MPKRIGLYPGTFDPVTLGHRDIIHRAAAIVDELVIAVAINRDKKPLFSLEERHEMMSRVAEEVQSETECVVRVVPFENLLVDFAKAHNANLLIRGLRAVSDFEYEYQMVGMNRALDPELETVFLMSDGKYQAIASRLVKEIARLGGQVTNFVSPHVEKALKAKFVK